MPTAICILGVSRSGTSAVSRTFNLLGAHVGSAQDLMPAAADNPTGFWERRDIFEFHERLLRELSRGWETTAVLPEGWHELPAMGSFRSELKGLIETAFGGRDIWAWKDPRSAVLLPLWKHTLAEMGVALRCVVVVRNPIDVAGSLADRNDFGISHGLGLWFDHMLGMLHHSAGLPRGFITFDGLLSDWRAEVSRCCAEMEFEWPPGRKEVDGEIATFLDRGLVHRSSTIEDLERQASPAVVELFRLVLSAATRKGFQATGEFCGSVDLLLRGQREAASVFTAGFDRRFQDLRHSQEQALHQIEAIARQAEADNETLSEQNDALSEQNLTLSEQYAALSTQSAVLSERLARTVAEKSHLTERLWIVEHSLGWRLIDRVRSIENWLLPSGSRRRRGYDFLWRALKTGLFLGWSKFVADAGSILRGTTQPKRTEPQTSGALLAPAESLALTFFQVDEPQVSIVIPVHDNAPYTLRCLRSIQDRTDLSRIEIIVVDDGSTDNTPAMLQSAVNVRVLTQQNSGFLLAANAGAAVARGEYVFFLNNDTEVQDGWLEAMLSVFSDSPSVGAVGAKLVYPDGRLQEAGGIVWRDGTGWNYGKWDDPARPEYNYVKEVDYCSGAALMVRLDVFKQVGGFDNRFCPMYYEDTDLCFAVRQSGFRVLYQPAAVVVHHEGATAGTDTASGSKKYQEVNRVTFCAKWAEPLRDQLSPPEGDVSTTLFAGRERTAGKRILFVDHYVPEPDRDSGSLRTFEWIKILVELGHKVVFLPDNRNRSEPYTSALQQLGVEVLYGRLNFKQYMAKFAPLLDVAILSRPHIAPKYIDICRQYRNLYVIYDSVELVWVREHRQAEVEGDSRRMARSRRVKSEELSLVRSSHLVLTVSAVEEELLRAEEPGANVRTVPHVHHPADRIPPLEARQDLLFIGGFQHPPNADAVRWFAEEILPLVALEIPGIRLRVVGSQIPDDLRAMESDQVRLEGFVENVAPFFEGSRVFVAPLRSGAGVKGKILQSMSFALPIVTTTVGAEGLRLVDGETAGIADDAATFAAKVVELYRDEELWKTVSSGSLELLKATHTVDTCRTSFVEILALSASVMSVGSSAWRSEAASPDA